MFDTIEPFSSLLKQIDDAKEQMLEQTIELANINSGSLHAQGVNRVLVKLKQMMSCLNAEQTVVPVKPFEMIDDNGQLLHLPLGDALVVSKRPKAPLQIVLSGHMDTVFAKDDAFQEVKFLSNNKINGPGVSDLKGGLVIMIEALKVLESSEWAEYVGWQVVLNSDEEIGSASSHHLFEQAAKTAHLGMLYEPSFPDGSLAGARKGSGNFTVVCTGKAAHAGREHHIGRNAVVALSEFFCQLDQLNGQRKGVTINPARINGGGASNVVPAQCLGRFNIRVAHPSDEAWFMEQLQHLIDGINQKEGIALKLHGGFTRKPKVLTDVNLKFFELVRQVGQSLGMTLDVHDSGGCCDGNNLASLGVPNIDTLGVQGGAIHSDQEYMYVDSLVPRAKLSAILLLYMAKNEAQGSGNEWLKR